ncbi:hypothetical protein EDB89DRAFT_306609 [Lactarius sanguifluus]|nr:hypothetical protein EDB89DRAFT_306609 [Lactarius sanguifluus]
MLCPRTLLGTNSSKAGPCIQWDEAIVSGWVRVAHLEFNVRRHCDPSTQMSFFTTIFTVQLGERSPRQELRPTSQQQTVEHQVPAVRSILVPPSKGRPIVTHTAPTTCTLRNRPIHKYSMPGDPPEGIKVTGAGIGPGTVDHQYPPPEVTTKVPQEAPSFADGSGPIFSMYSERATEDDEKMAESWKADAEGILVFVRLSSNPVLHT